MNPLKTCFTGATIIALIAAFSATTLAKKTVIMDEELDEMTASGQPKIAQAESFSGNATAVNFQVNVFAAHIGGQKELTALTLNNIFGENQIANAVNIKSGIDTSGSQSYSALQSWGSSKVYDSRTVAGQPGGFATCEATGLIAKCSAQNGPGAGGAIALLWMFADEIAHAEVGSDNANSTDQANGSENDANASNVVVTIVAAGVDAVSQTELTALTVNNIFGFNQVANGLNISSGSVDSNGGVSIGASLGGSSTDQLNDINQFRGAPYNWWKAPTFERTPPPPPEPPD